MYRAATLMELLGMNTKLCLFDLFCFVFFELLRLTVYFCELSITAEYIKLNWQKKEDLFCFSVFWTFRFCTILIIWNVIWTFTERFVTEEFYKDCVITIIPSFKENGRDCRLWFTVVTKFFLFFLTLEFTFLLASCDRLNVVDFFVLPWNNCMLYALNFCDWGLPLNSNM